MNNPGLARKGIFAGMAFLAATALSANDGSGVSETARLIAGNSLIVDTHIDVPYRLVDHWEDVTRGTELGDFDYERAHQGGLDVPFMSIFVPANLEAEGGSYDLANQLIDSVEAIVGRAPDKFALVASTADAEKARSAGLIGLAMGMENGSPVEGKLENLAFFHQRGIRYITLAHSLSNHISDSSYDENHQWNGLSPFGKEVVAEMNRLGIMVDISHVTDEAFYQAVEISRAPVIASHSGVRHFTPGWERNMNDEMIKALAANGGVIQIPFGSGFISQQAYEWRQLMVEKMKEWAEENGESIDMDHRRQWEEEYRNQNPYPYATLSDVVDVIEHVVQLVGHEHVGLGSDFDGVGDSLPRDLRDVSWYPNLIDELLRREYPAEQIQAILGGNLMRVWRDVEAYSQQAQARENTGTSS
jgi:membrane dipeptidase